MADPDGAAANAILDTASTRPPPRNELNHLPSKDFPKSVVMFASL
jgi:hypothetical protein